MHIHFLFLKDNDNIIDMDQEQYMYFSHITGYHSKPNMQPDLLISTPQFTSITAQKELING